ncbi:MAG TPA: WD40 repeat domain-containing protein [Gammaproteobacteria bacterium]|nr:WD40 repeat domain-containing protein [Gammaproteobacteria bacterium]
MKCSTLFKTTALALTLLSASVQATENDIYAVHFSQDGKYLITGGAGGYTLASDAEHTGGIKIWDAGSGKLVEALGDRKDLDTLFGNAYGRVGNRRWGISNFKDVVLTGSYPDGKVLLLPTSLGRIIDNRNRQLPDFIGGYLDFERKRPQRIELSQLEGKNGNCDPKTGFHDYVGPIVPSNNGHYAAIVVNTCTATKKGPDGQVAFEYSSDLHVMDLEKFEITHSVEHIDAGVYALGITDAGNRVAFVGRDRFAVLDVDTRKQRIVEAYQGEAFMIPRQFSTLQFSKDGSKLISLRNIYDIETGVETPLKWSEGDAKKPRRISSVRVAPDLSYFAIVVPKRAFITFGDDGLPRSYGKADKIILLSTATGERTELEVTDSMTEGKRCVTDISPDSRHVAVGCKGGLLRVYDARSGKLIWHKQNVGQKSDNGLMHVQHELTDTFYSMLENPR